MRIITSKMNGSFSVRGIVGMLVAVGVSGVTAWGADYYADASMVDDSGAGINWSTAKQTIQAAVDLASDGDTVWVTNGVYNLGSRVAEGEELASRLCVTNAITVRSVNGPEVTTVTGAPGSNGGLDADAIRGVYLNDGASLFNFSITNGYTTDDAANGNGAGVWIGEHCVVSNCSIRGNVAVWDGGGAFLDRYSTLIQCSLSGNQAHAGGGAYLDNYGTEITDCVVSNNSALSYGAQGGGLFFHGRGEALRCRVVDNFSNVSGGGIYFWEDGTATDCLIEGNRGHRGAGVYLNGSYFAGRLLNCMIRLNSATESGGGLFLQAGTEVTTCSVISNSATMNGGGAYFEEGGTMDGCVFLENTADNLGGGACLKDGGTLNGCVLAGNNGGYGGGVYLMNHGGVLRNCTISQNSATSEGGGVRSYNGGAITNSIIWDNSSDLNGQDIYSYGVAPSIAYSCASDGLTNGVDHCITNNPMFMDGAALDFQLQRGSPCIDAGDDNALLWTYTDLAGNLRKVGVAIDMGALESDFQPLDTDEDGIPDWWEEQYYQGPTNAVAQQMAANGLDTVLEAYIAGLDPTNATSRFVVEINSTGMNPMVQWNTVTGRMFCVYWSSNLASNFTVLQSNIQWNAEGFIDEQHPQEMQGFYKVDVQLED